MHSRCFRHRSANCFPPLYLTVQSILSSLCRRCTCQKCCLRITRCEVLTGVIWNKELSITVVAGEAVIQKTNLSTASIDPMQCVSFNHISSLIREEIVCSVKYVQCFIRCHEQAFAWSVIARNFPQISQSYEVVNRVTLETSCTNNHRSYVWNIRTIVRWP